MTLKDMIDSELEEQMRGLERADWIGMALGAARALGVVIALVVIAAMLFGGRS